MRSLVTLLVLSSLYICISLHNAEGCCCNAWNHGESDCNFFGCNCEKLHNGYCRSCQKRWGKDRKGSYCYPVPDYNDYCADKKRKREINEWDDFSSMDSNQDGIIVFEEALAFTNIAKMENVNSHLDWATRQWTLMDKNQDGYVTPNEMQIYLG